MHDGNEAADDLDAVVVRKRRKGIYVLPNLEAANMLVRQLAHLSHAEIAGIVLGCKVPVILSNPTDGARTRVASVALARLLVKA